MGVSFDRYYRGTAKLDDGAADSAFTGSSLDMIRE